MKPRTHTHTHTYSGTILLVAHAFVEIHKNS